MISTDDVQKLFSFLTIRLTFLTWSQEEEKESERERKSAREEERKTKRVVHFVVTLMCHNVSEGCIDETLMFFWSLKTSFSANQILEVKE